MKEQCLPLDWTKDLKLTPAVLSDKLHQQLGRRRHECFKREKSWHWIPSFHKEWTSRTLVTSVVSKAVWVISQKVLRCSGNVTSRDSFPPSILTMPQTWHHGKEKKNPGQNNRRDRCHGGETGLTMHFTALDEKLQKELLKVNINSCTSADCFRAT